jgi:hypothetical protein
MKVKWALSLLSLTLLLGCTSIPTDHDTNTAVAKPKPIPQQQPTSNDDQTTEHLSNVNKPFEVGHWQITLKPNVVDPKWPEFDNYNLECTYLGNSKVTHAKLSFGNGTAEAHDLSHGEGMVIGSTFPKDTKQIDFNITTTEENGGTVAQSQVLMTGH